MSAACKARVRMKISGMTRIVEHPAVPLGADAANLGLSLGDVNLTLHIGTLGPADVGQGIPKDMLRAGVDRYFHFAAVKAHRRTWRRLLHEPDVHELGRSGIDLARRSEGFLQPAYRFADIVGRDARYWADRKARLTACGDQQSCHRNRRSGNTQHIPFPNAEVWVSSVAGRGHLAADSLRRLKNQLPGAGVFADSLRRLKNQLPGAGVFADLLRRLKNQLPGAGVFADLRRRLKIRRVRAPLM